MVGLWDVASNDKVKVLKGDVEATSMRSKVTVEEGRRPCCYQKSMKMELKYQPP